MSGLSILAQAGKSFWMPPEGSTFAGDVDAVFDFIFWVSFFFFALIVFLMVLFIVKYRWRKDRIPKPTAHTHLGIEITWTAIPFLVVAAIFYVGFTTFVNMATPPQDAYGINVIAQKWSWVFRYPGGHEDSELHVPIDRPILLTMRSEDVIHSLWVPAFRMKMDVRPGAYSKAWFEAKKVGEYPLVCSEYCGTEHSTMVTKVVVHPPGGYEKWLREAASMLSPLLKKEDFLDGPVVLGRLKEGTDPAARFVAGELTPETKALLDSWTGGEPSEELVKALLTDLNEVLKGENIHVEDRFAGVDLGDDTRAALAAAPPPEAEDLQQLNRYLLADALPGLRRELDAVKAGKYLYERKGGCIACHSLDGTKKTGPTFLGVYGSRHALSRPPGEVVVDENYIRESILAPDAKVVEGYGERSSMPTYKGRLSDREIDYLIEFIKSVKKSDN